MKVYVKGKIDPTALARLEAKVEIVSDFEDMEHIDALYIKADKVTRADLERAKNLKIISRQGIGCDMIDMEAAKEFGIPVKNVPGGNAESVAELAVSYMMSLSRRVKYFDQGLANGLFEQITPKGIMGMEMTGKTLAIIGTGSISKRVAEIMKAAFGMRVLAFSTHLTEEKARENGWIMCNSILEMLPEADYINVSVPLTNETRGLIGKEEFAAMKPTAIFVNTARGPVVDEDALYEALSEHKIWGAGCDVFNVEPPKPDNPLLKLDNFIATPHMGSSTYESMKRCGNIAVDHIFEALGIVG